jgi:hypothetical protein
MHFYFTDSANRPFTASTTESVVSMYIGHWPDSKVCRFALSGTVQIASNWGQPKWRFPKTYQRPDKRIVCCIMVAMQCLQQYQAILSKYSVEFIAAVEPQVENKGFHTDAAPS